MKYQQQALNVQAQGRGPDTMLVHMAPSEVAGLQALAEQYGGSLTINPETGLPEAGFLESLLPAIIGTVVTIGTGNPYLGALAGGAVGGATAEEGENPWVKAAMGAVGGYGGGTMASAFGAGAGAAGAGATEAGLAALGETAAATAGTGVTSALIPGMSQAEMLAAQTAGMGITDAAIPLVQQSALAGAYGMDGAYNALNGTVDVLGDGVYGAAVEPGLTGPAYESAMNEVLAANEAGAAEIPMNDPSGYDVFDNPWDKAKYWWKTGGKENLDKGMKAYGIASKALGGGQRQPQQMLPIQSAGGYQAQASAMPTGGAGSGAPLRWSANAGAATPGAARTSLEQERRAAFARGQGFARQGFAFPGRSFAEGGVVELNEGGFVVPSDVVAAIGSGSTDAGLQALSKFGAQPLKGPGDGQRDGIVARIDGRQEARVSNGEAYLPPRVVAEFGGGDHSKGAKRLYNMLDQVRRQAYGHTEQMRPVKLDKALA